MLSAHPGVQCQTHMSAVGHRGVTNRLFDLQLFSVTKAHYPLWLKKINKKTFNMLRGEGDHTKKSHAHVWVCVCVRVFVCLSVGEIAHEPLGRFYLNSQKVLIEKHLQLLNFWSHPDSRRSPQLLNISKHKNMVISVLLIYFSDLVW